MCCVPTWLGENNQRWEGQVLCSAGERPRPGWCEETHHPRHSGQLSSQHRHQDETTFQVSRVKSSRTNNLTSNSGSWMLHCEIRIPRSLFPWETNQRLFWLVEQSWNLRYISQVLEISRLTWISSHSPTDELLTLEPGMWFLVINWIQWQVIKMKIGWSWRRLKRWVLSFDSNFLYNKTWHFYTSRLILSEWIPTIFSMRSSSLISTTEYHQVWNW